ncbi:MULTISPECIES: HAD-IIA family hydrolase [unclassified Roseovarius]|uniref:HAD-IIA family hydrolase n=1 Tax=unclassified Roseovarius TaxID=2614913 RepID=UPI00273DD899|nr:MULTISPECIES: HAD hydrolase-like protein [unclassified Roseovarius]
MSATLRDTKSVFERYEAVRPRLPVAARRTVTREVPSLLAVADEVDAFVFDAFGVLNVGETPIPGAAARLDALRQRGCAIRVLTNAASYQRDGAIAKFKRLGMRLEDDEIITSRDATLRVAGPRNWGIIAASGDTLADIPGGGIVLHHDSVAYEQADAFLFLSTADWDAARQEILESSLARNPREVLIANADLVAPRDYGFSLEPGFYGHQIADRTKAPVRFFGKPFGDVFAMVEASLPGIAKDRIAMCGDSLHTDILGAVAAGWRSVLVTQDGLFAGSDVGAYAAASGIHADWQVARI